MHINSLMQRTVEMISLRKKCNNILLLNICDGYYHWCCTVYYQRTIDTLGITHIHKH